MTLTPPIKAMMPASGTTMVASGTPCAAASEISADEKLPTTLATKISANSTRPMGTMARIPGEVATDMPAPVGGRAGSRDRAAWVWQDGGCDEGAAARGGEHGAGGDRAAVAGGPARYAGGGAAVRVHAAAGVG